MTTGKLPQQLRINARIQDSLNQVLRQMQGLVDNTRIYESRMEIHQMSNLVAVATETTSVEVVKKYIQYQVGRDERSNSWRWRVGSGKNFGERLVGQLDALKDTAEGIVRQEGGSDQAVDRAWIRLTRLYVGHLRRYFYYRKKTRGGK